MAFTSDQINQMIGAQNAMFANQGVMAQNVGAAVGIGGAPGVQGMSSPNFGGTGYGGQDFIPGGANTSPGGYGAAIAGGFGQAIPGMATGLAFAGGLGFLGQAGRYMDPFIGVGKGFMSGFRAAGGLGAGAGAVGGGVIGAMGPAALYYGAGQAISHVGEQIYQGAQQTGQVASMAQQFMGPQYGQVGARPGGQMARGQIDTMVNVLREVAGEETMASMKDLMSIMDKAGREGLLSGVHDASQFRTRFRKIIDQSKQIAEILGTTIEEGTEALTGMQRMGLWTARDVVGTASAMRQVGPGGKKPLQDTMGYGAGGSKSRGGTLAAGANLARNQFLNVQAAVREGVLPPEMVQELAGGVGGVEGQRIVSDRLTSGLQTLAQTDVGQMAIAGLSEVKDGRFTGRIDSEKLAQFQRGEISLNRLQSLGMRNTRSRRGAASFEYRREHLGQQLMSEGGMDLAKAMFDQAVRKAGMTGASDEEKGILFQQLSGQSREGAMTFQRMFSNLDKIKESKSRRALSTLEDTLRQSDERRNKSFEGLEDAVRLRYEETLERPLQELGQRMTKDINEILDQATDLVKGRTRQTSMTRTDMVREVASGQGARSPEEMSRMMNLFTTSGVQSTFGPQRGLGGLIQRMRSRETGFFHGIGSGLMSAVGLETGEGTRAQVLADMGVPVLVGDVGTASMSDGNVLLQRTLSQDWFMRSNQVRTGVEQIQRRAMGLTAEQAFGVGQEGSEKRDQAYAKARSVYRRLMGDAKFRREMSENKKSMSPNGYAKWLAGKMRAVGGSEYNAAKRILMEASPPGTTNTSLDMDIISASQQDPSAMATGFEVDFGAIASDSGSRFFSALQDGEAFAAEMSKQTGDVLKLIRGGRMDTQGYLNQRSVLVGARDVGVSSQEFSDLINASGPLGSELREFLSSGSTDMSKFPELMKKSQPGTSLNKLISAVGQMSKDEREQLVNEMQDVSGLRGAKATATMIRERGVSASEELRTLGGRGSDGLRNVLRTLEGASQQSGGTQLTSYQKAREMALEEAQRIAGSKGGADEIRRLRQSGGAVAEHIADLATLARLDPRKLAGKSGKRVKDILGGLGLGDDAEKAMQVLGRDDARELEKILSSSGKLTRDQAQTLKGLLTKFEVRAGLEDGEKQRAEAQEKLGKSLTSFADANTKFVQAVAVALPNLDKVTGEQIAQRAKELGKNTDTGGLGGGRE